MRRIGNDETFSAVTTVSGDTVKVARSVKPDAKSSTRYAVALCFDFKDVSREELIAIAVRQLIVDVQNGGLRADIAAGMDEITFAAKWEDKPIMVKRDIVDRERKRSAADPMAKAKKMMEGLTVEQRRAIMEDMGLGTAERPKGKAKAA